MEEKHLIITGVPRGATGYAAKFFSHNNFDVGHEEFGNFGISSWCVALGGDEALYGPSLNECFDRYGKDTPVLHQTRDPLKNISSLTIISQGALNYMGKFTQLPSTNSKLEACMKLWLDWSKITEHIASERYRVEDIEEKFPAMIPYPNKLHNERRCKYYTVSDLMSTNYNLALEVIKKAEEYGYPYMREQLNAIFNSVDQI